MSSECLFVLIACVLELVGLLNAVVDLYAWPSLLNGVSG